MHPKRLKDTYSATKVSGATYVIPHCVSTWAIREPECGKCEANISTTGVSNGHECATLLRTWSLPG